MPCFKKEEGKEEAKRGRTAGWCQRTFSTLAINRECTPRAWDQLFRWAYHMTYPTFLELHRLLGPEMMIIHKEYMDNLTISSIPGGLTRISLNAPSNEVLELDEDMITTNISDVVNSNG
jgi:hypothetical protein